MEARHWPCGGCGAKVEYAPGQDHLRCPHCGAQTALSGPSDEEIASASQEHDFESWVGTLGREDAGSPVVEVKCPACGAETQFGPHVVADRCPFCATPLGAAAAETVRKIAPQALVPFAIEEGAARARFRKWITGLWFAPNALQTSARAATGIRGCYLPFWTFDAEAETPYSGERGDYYYETERYTENGQSRTRQVRRTRWRSVSGRVENSFDDVLAPGSNTVPQAARDSIEPWPLSSIKPFRPEYTAGFLVETYQIDLPTGFQHARGTMEAEIRSTICRDIGGDEQRIHGMRPAYRDITWKHLLLPIWVSSYHYGGKSWRFFVNGHSGAIWGERPWSAWKIAFAVIAGLALAAIVLALSQQQGA